MPQLAQNGQGNYLVFWWEQIALGDVYLEADQVPDEEAYRAIVLKAITPAVQHYAAKTGHPPNHWSAWYSQQEFARWISWMQTVFAPYQHAALPPRVPVSVVICTRNRAAILRLCLESLRGLACQPEEIVVVDNAPTDDSTQQVVAAYPGVRYCVEPRPGLSHARNTGVAQASCSILAFTDDDVVLHPDWVYQVWQTFQDQTVFAMTGLVLVSELQTEAQQIFEKHWSFNRGYQDIYYDPAYLQRVLPTGPPVWHIGAGANNAFRKAVFEEVGLFDERLGAGASGCSEDSEMWFRILTHGHTIHYNPRAVVYHAHRQHLHELQKQIFAYMRGHAAAALIQQEQCPQAGYTNYLYWSMPKYYALLIRIGFPFFRFRSRTLWTEVKGLASGVLFYYRNRKRASNLPS
ncbi:glycosyltransferase family 2 protein [Hymenobacter telluris]|nr:glycosyltransferase [Hymenobacter telluris]